MRLVDDEQQQRTADDQNGTGSGICRPESALYP